jgi:hypothetical protein
VSNVSASSWWEQVTFQWDDDDVHFVLDQHFHSVNSLKQQFTYTHVTSLGHTILFPRQPIFALIPQFSVFRWEIANTNFIVFGLTHRDWLDPSGLAWPIGTGLTHWDLKPHSTTLKASNLTIRPPMQFITTDVVSLNLDQGEVYNIMW